MLSNLNDVALCKLTSSTAYRGLPNANVPFCSSASHLHARYPERKSTFNTLSHRKLYYRLVKIRGILIFLHSKMGCGWFWEFSASCPLLYSTSCVGYLRSKKLRVPVIPHLMRKKWKKKTVYHVDLSVSLILFLDGTWSTLCSNRFPPRCRYFLVRLATYWWDKSIGDAFIINWLFSQTEPSVSFSTKQAGLLRSVTDNFFYWLRGCLWFALLP